MGRMGRTCLISCCWCSPSQPEQSVPVTSVRPLFIPAIVCLVYGLNVVIQMNWPLPATGISIMQLGTVRGILQRSKNKTGGGSLLPNVPVLTQEETFARGNTVGPGLKQRFPSLTGARMYFFPPFLFFFFHLCFQRKLFALMPLTVVVLEHSFGKQSFSVRIFVRTVIDFGCFRKTSSFY